MTHCIHITYDTADTENGNQHTVIVDGEHIRVFEDAATGLYYVMGGEPGADDGPNAETMEGAILAYWDNL